MGTSALNLTHCPDPQPHTTITTVTTATAAGAATAPRGNQLSAFGDSLLTALAALLPLVRGLPLGIAACNASAGRASWRPRQTYPDAADDDIAALGAAAAGAGVVTDDGGSGGGGRVSSSPLQLPPGTLLLVDESVMGEGRLEAAGVENLQALARLARDQVRWCNQPRYWGS